MIGDFITIIIQMEMYIKVGSSPEQKVMTFSFKENIRCLAGDPNLMKNSNWSYNDVGNKCGDLNTGDWWKNAER